MLEKTEKLIITFYTTADALAMEQLCKEKQMKGRLIPVPGSISADCGLAWCASLEDEEAVSRFISDNNLRTQGFHRCLV